MKHFNGWDPGARVMAPGGVQGQCPWQGVHGEPLKRASGGYFLFYLGVHSSVITCSPMKPRAGMYRTV